jgi:hypothetical protein
VRAVVRAHGWSHRRRPRIGWDELKRSARDSTVILALWHEQVLLALEPMSGLVRSGAGLTAMVSQSRDGELATRVARPWGYRVVRGSASRGGQAGLRALYQHLVRNGDSLLMLPDGPRGPRREVKPGVVVLAQTSGVPIQPVGLAASSCWRLRSWDRLVVPRPFATIAIACGERRPVARQLDGKQRQQECHRLGEELDRLTARAEELLGSRRSSRGSTS